MADIKFEIEKEIGKISESSKGWTKELNLISWNGKEAKYDLRDWAPEHEKMGKAINLIESKLSLLDNDKDLVSKVDELKKLKEILNEMNI